MKILLVAMGIAPSSGGPTRSIKGLCRGLAQAGVDVTLLVLSDHNKFEDPCGVKVLYATDKVAASNVTFLNLYTAQNSTALRDFDLVHLQGLWNPGLHKIACACRKQHVPYMISPRGMLDPWALSVKKWKKRLALFLYQRRDLKGAVAFHVTAEMERDHVRACGFTQPCIIAPNGVNVPVDVESLPRQNQNQSSATSHFSPLTSHSSSSRTAIFLSRLHPGKGLIPLAEAWARVKPQGWRMLVVGPDSYGHKTEVIKKLDALGIPHRDLSKEQALSTPTPSTYASSPWHFLDQVNDTEKWALYHSAEILIHPSVSENFGITIAEGLYAGLPVIATKGTPWKDLEDHQCGLWIDQGVDALASALSNLLTLEPSKLRAMGANGHKLILEKYTWSSVAQTMLIGYRNMIK